MEVKALIVELCHCKSEKEYTPLFKFLTVSRGHMNWEEAFFRLMNSMEK